MSNLKAGKPFFCCNFLLQLFTNPSIVIKIINVKQMIIRKRKQFWLYSDTKNNIRYSSVKTYSEGFFHPVRWSYGNKPFGNESEDDDEFRRMSNSSKSSDKAL